MRLKALFWTLLAVTLGVYLVIVLWSLPRIAAEAGGIVPFDMRPAGYSLDDAKGFLTALSDSGRAFYLGTQHLLDLAYPALLGVTLAVGFVILFRGRCAGCSWPSASESWGSTGWRTRPLRGCWWPIRSCSTPTRSHRPRPGRS
jgi:hypothetical protein